MADKAERIADIMSVQGQNWKTHNPPGVDPEVMADIGYTRFEDMPGIIDSIRTQPPEAVYLGQTALQTEHDKAPIPQDIRDHAQASRERRAADPLEQTIQRRRRNLYGISDN